MRLSVVCALAHPMRCAGEPIKDSRMRVILPTMLTFSLQVTMTAGQASDQTLLHLPAPVTSTIEREANGRTIAAIACDERDGRRVYRVRITQEGIDQRLLIGSDGMVLDSTDHSALNQAIAVGKQIAVEAWDNTTEAGVEAWDATKNAANRTWEATRDTVRHVTTAYHSDDLTLNQVPRAPRETMERTAAGNRLSDIHAIGVEHSTHYRATITHPDGTLRSLVVREDGTLVTAP